LFQNRVFQSKQVEPRLTVLEMIEVRQIILKMILIKQNILL
jgi:hypothetical protein